MIQTSSPWRLPRGDAGVLAPGRGFLARAVAWTTVLFASIIAAMFASVRLPAWLERFAHEEMACALIIPALTLVAYVVAVRLVERRRVSELAIARAPLELAAGALTGFAYTAATLFALWIFGLYRVRLGTWQHGWHYFVFDAYISGVLEELAFRAALLRLFAQMWGPVPGWLLSSALFGLAHAGHASPIAMAEIFFDGGLLFGVLFLVSGRLWLSMGAHLAYDFTEWSLMGVGDHDGLLVVTPTPGYSDWLTGGAFGPDGSALAAVIGVLLIAFILNLRLRMLAQAGTTHRD